MASILPPTYETSFTSSPPTYTPNHPASDSSMAPPSIIEDESTLPQYTFRPVTEPHTLSKTLFHWGFLCPFLWMLGISILWIDLKADDTLEQEEAAVSAEDLVKREQERQVMDEKIGIVRKVRLGSFTSF